MNRPTNALKNRFIRLKYYLLPENLIRIQLRGRVQKLDKSTKYSLHNSKDALDGSGSIMKENSSRCNVS